MRVKVAHLDDLVAFSHNFNFIIKGLFYNFVSKFLFGFGLEAASMNQVLSLKSHILYLCSVFLSAGDAGKLVSEGIICSNDE